MAVAQSTVILPSLGSNSRMANYGSMIRLAKDEQEQSRN
jgi:hypothetical protein